MTTEPLKIVFSRRGRKGFKINLAAFGNRVRYAVVFF
jgi:hypothetical protein